MALSTAPVGDGCPQCAGPACAEKDEADDGAVEETDGEGARPGSEEKGKRRREGGGCCPRKTCRDVWYGTRMKLWEIVESKYFNRGIMIAILINTISMGIEHHEQVLPLSRPPRGARWLRGPPEYEPDDQIQPMKPFQTSSLQPCSRFLELCSVRSPWFYQYFRLSPYHRPLVPATATAVGRLPCWGGGAKNSPRRNERGRQRLCSFNGEETAGAGGACVSGGAEASSQTLIL